MRKFGILLVLLFIVGTMHAQRDVNGFKKGDNFMSGSIGFGTVSHSDDSKEINYGISPRYGYFLNDFVAVGGRVGYDYLKRKNPAGEKVLENSTIIAGLFGRYYLFPGSKFSFFGELGLGFGSTKNINNHWTNGINAGISPGISYFLTEHFALEASFGMLSYNTVNPGGNSGSTDSFKVGIDMEDIQFGIILKF